MWICYKSDCRWQGPVKVHGIDGTKIYAVRGGKLATLNSYDVVLAKPELSSNSDSSYTHLDDCLKESLGDITKQTTINSTA